MTLRLAIVFAWGWNKYGQLGLGTVENQFVPRAVDVEGLCGGEVCVVGVACGWWHSLLMLKAAVQSASGEVKQFG